MDSKRGGKEGASSSGGPSLQRSKCRQRIMEYNSRTTSKGIALLRVIMESRRKGYPLTDFL
ncbi:hypothetical protein MTR_2g461400 [Medicago truncatula]|uniref:Uncharacterized protein n=1 Tax=Medicago truncatula TaxID=3880 RepID=A0A072V8Z8_MEDTR|nr:hypothetical protein MTR_2g461400 [Medicago truncatula]